MSRRAAAAAARTVIRKNSRNTYGKLTVNTILTYDVHISTVVLWGTLATWTGRTDTETDINVSMLAICLQTARNCIFYVVR